MGTHHQLTIQVSRSVGLFVTATSNTLINTSFLYIQWVNLTIVAFEKKNVLFLSLFLSPIHSLCLYLWLSYFPVEISLEHYLDIGGSGESKQEVLYTFTSKQTLYWSIGTCIDFVLVINFFAIIPR